jgi:putative spermidine/putrescine transport system permease protein
MISETPMQQAGGARRCRWLVSKNLLLAPLVAFLLVTFALPISTLLFRSVQSEEMSSALPKTAELLKAWDGKDVPDDRLVLTFFQELSAARGTPVVTQLASRLNTELPGFRGLLMATARKTESFEQGNLREQLIAADARWGDPLYWQVMKRSAGPLTSFYLLSALDLQKAADGSIKTKNDDEAIFRIVFARTFGVSAVTTLLCLLLGLPTAILIAGASPKWRGILLLFVLIPFWTSILARATAWLVLMQKNGVINDSLIWMKIIDAPLELIFTRGAVYVSSVYVLLPFMVLPIYNSMRKIDTRTVYASLSLGASPLVTLVRIYIPQAAPGIGSGTLLVFILSLGFYVVPSLIGGAKDQMLGYFIAFYTNQTLNWGMAGALSVILAIMTALTLFLALALKRGLASRTRSS